MGVARRRWNASASSAVTALTVVKTSAVRAVTPSSECLATMSTSRAACSGVLPSRPASGSLPSPASARPSMVAWVVNTVPIAGACWLTWSSAVPAIHSCANNTAGLPAGATRSRHQRSTTIPAARPNITGST